MSERKISQSKSMIEQISKYLLLLPLFHIALVYIYFLAFSSGFGANIEIFADSGILFSIGISKIIQFYALMAVSLVYAYFSMDAEPTNFKKEKAFELHPTLKGKWMDTLDWIYFLSALSGAILWYVLKGKILYFLILISIMFPLSRVIAWIAAKNGMKHNALLVTIMSVFVVSILVVTGLGEGEKIRNIRYGEIADKYPKCNDLLSVFSLGTNFIAVDKKEKRYVINEKCEVLFDVPFDKKKFDSYNVFNNGGKTEPKVNKPNDLQEQDDENSSIRYELREDFNRSQ